MLQQLVVFHAMHTYFYTFFNTGDPQPGYDEVHDPGRPTPSYAPLSMSTLRATTVQHEDSKTVRRSPSAHRTQPGTGHRQIMHHHVSSREPGSRGFDSTSVPVLLGVTHRILQARSCFVLHRGRAKEGKGIQYPTPPDHPMNP